MLFRVPVARSQAKFSAAAVQKGGVWREKVGTRLHGEEWEEEE